MSPTPRKGPAFAGPTRAPSRINPTPPPVLAATDQELAGVPGIGRRAELAGGDDDFDLEVEELADRLERHGPASPESGHALARRILRGAR